MGAALSGEYENTAKSSIAFDRSNTLWAKPKPLHVNPQSLYFTSGNPYTSRKR